MKNFVSTAQAAADGGSDDPGNQENIHIYDQRLDRLIYIRELQK